MIGKNYFLMFFVLFFTTRVMLGDGFTDILLLLSHCGNQRPKLSLYIFAILLSKFARKLSKKTLIIQLTEVASSKISSCFKMFFSIIEKMNVQRPFKRMISQWGTQCSSVDFVLPMLLFALFWNLHLQHIDLIQSPFFYSNFFSQ